jgi:hypothetical protein
MKVCSIGFYREDGDFAILATLNNNDEFIPLFDDLIFRVISRLQSDTDEPIIALERQDAPDYVAAEE